MALISQLVLGDSSSGENGSYRGLLADSGKLGEGGFLEVDFEANKIVVVQNLSSFIFMTALYLTIPYSTNKYPPSFL